MFTYGHTLPLHDALPIEPGVDGCDTIPVVPSMVRISAKFGVSMMIDGSLPRRPGYLRAIMLAGCVAVMAAASVGPSALAQSAPGRSEPGELRDRKSTRLNSSH